MLDPILRGEPPDNEPLITTSPPKVAVPRTAVSFDPIVPDTKKNVSVPISDKAVSDVLSNIPPDVALSVPIFRF